MLNSDNRNFLYTVIFTFVTLAVIWSLYGFRKDIFYAKNLSPDKALSEGVGYYETPVSLGCVTSDNLCDKPGTQTFVSRCIPHPDTGKGCFDEETGAMTYETKITTESCNKPCVKHGFSIQQGVDFQTELEAVVQNSIIPSLDPNSLKRVFKKGVNRVIDPYYGIDHTSDYFGDYNSNTQVYEMKTVPGTDYGKCIPTNLTGYYQTKYACVDNDQSGLNLCNYMCGVEKTIGISGLYAQNTTSENVLMHYPYYNQNNGEKFYYCYDQLGNNLLEGLYNSETVPAGFVYPKHCYTRYITNFNQKGRLISDATYNTKYITLDNNLTAETNNYEVTNSIGNSSLDVPSTYTENDTDSLIIAKVGVEYMRVKSIASDVYTANIVADKFFLYSTEDQEDIGTLQDGIFFNEYTYVYELSSNISTITNNTVAFNQVTSAISFESTDGGTNATPSYIVFEGNPNIISIASGVASPSLAKLAYIDDSTVYQLDNYNGEKAFITKGLRLNGTSDDISDLTLNTSYEGSHGEEITFIKSKVITDTTNSIFVPYSYKLNYGGDYTDSSSDTSFTIDKYQNNFVFHINNTKTAKILEVERKFENSLVVPHPKNTTVHFIHNLAEKVADFTELMSPYILNSDGTIENACFDEYNRPRPSGYKIRMESGQTLIANIESNEYNLNSNAYNSNSAICGVYGYLEEGNSVPRGPSQTKSEYVEKLITDSECVTSSISTSTSNTVSNMFKLGISSNTSINTITCFSGYFNGAEPRLCDIPYDPTLYRSNTIYDIGDVVYQRLYDSQFYLSIANNNNADLTNSNKWKEINYLNTVIENVSQGEYYITRSPNVLELIGYDTDAAYSWSIYRVLEGGLRSYDLSRSYNPYIDKNIYFPPKLVSAELSLDFPKGVENYPFDSRKPIITKPFYMEFYANKLLYAPTEITISDVGDILSSTDSTYRKFTSNGGYDFTFIDSGAIVNNDYLSNLNVSNLYVQGNGNWEHGLRLDVRPDIIYNNSNLTLDGFIDRTENQIDYRGFRSEFVQGVNTHRTNFLPSSNINGTVDFPYDLISRNYEPNWADNDANKGYGSRFGIYKDSSITLSSNMASNVNTLYWNYEDTSGPNIDLVTVDSSFGAKQLSERFINTLTNQIRVYYWPLYIPNYVAKSYATTEPDRTFASNILTSNSSLEEINLTEHAENGTSVVLDVPKVFNRFYKLGDIVLNDYTYTLPITGDTTTYTNNTMLNFYINHSYSFDDDKLVAGIENSNVSSNVQTIYDAGNVAIVPLFASKSIKDDMIDMSNSVTANAYAISYSDNTFSCVKVDDSTTDANLGTFNSLKTYDYFEAFNKVYAKSLSHPITTIEDDSVETDRAGVLWNSYSVEDGEFIIGRQSDGDTYRLLMLQKNQDFSKLDLYLNYPRPPAVFSLPEIEPFAVGPEQYSKIYCYINNIESIYNSDDTTGFIQRGKKVLWDDVAFEDDFPSLNGQHWNKRYMPFNQNVMQTGYSRFAKSIPGKLAFDGWGVRGVDRGSQQGNIGQYVVNVFLFNRRYNNKLMPVYRVDSDTEAPLQAWYTTATLPTLSDPAEDINNVLETGSSEWHVDTSRYSKLFTLPASSDAVASTNEWRSYLDNVWTCPGIAFQRDCSFIDGTSKDLSLVNSDNDSFNYYSIPFIWQNAVTSFFSDATIGSSYTKDVLYNDIIRTMFWGTGQSEWSSTMKMYNNYTLITSENADQASIAPVFVQTAPTGIISDVTLTTPSSSYIKIGNSNSPYIEDFLYTNQGVGQYIEYDPQSSMSSNTSITTNNTAILLLNYNDAEDIYTEKGDDYEYPSIMEVVKHYIEKYINGTDAIRLPLISSYSDIDDIPTSGIPGFLNNLIARDDVIKRIVLPSEDMNLAATSFTMTKTDGNVTSGKRDTIPIQMPQDAIMISGRGYSWMTQLYNNSLNGYSGLYFMNTICNLPVETYNGIRNYLTTDDNAGMGLEAIYYHPTASDVLQKYYNTLGLFNLMSSIGVFTNPYMYDRARAGDDTYRANFAVNSVSSDVLTQVCTSLAPLMMPTSGFAQYSMVVPVGPSSCHSSYKPSLIKSNSDVFSHPENLVLLKLGEIISTDHNTFTDFGAWESRSRIAFNSSYQEDTVNVGTTVNITGHEDRPAQVGPRYFTNYFFPQIYSFYDTISWYNYTNATPGSLSYPLNLPSNSSGTLFELYSVDLQNNTLRTLKTLSGSPTGIVDSNYQWNPFIKPNTPATNSILRVTAASIFGKGIIQNNPTFADVILNDNSYFLGGNQHSLIPYFMGLVHMYTNPYGIPTTYGDPNVVNPNDTYFQQSGIVPPPAMSGKYGYYYKEEDLYQSLLNDIPKPIRAAYDLAGYPNDVQDVGSGVTLTTIVGGMNDFFNNLDDYIQGRKTLNYVINKINDKIYTTQKEYFNTRRLNSKINGDSRFFHFDLPVNYYPGGWGLPTYNSDVKTITNNPVTFPINDCIPQNSYYTPRFTGGSIVINADTQDTTDSIINAKNIRLGVNESIDENWITKAGTATSTSSRKMSSLKYNVPSSYKRNVISIWEESTNVTNERYKTGYPIFTQATVQSDTKSYNLSYVIDKLKDDNDKFVNTNYGNALVTTSTITSKNVVTYFPLSTFYRMESPKWTAYAGSIFPHDGLNMCSPGTNPYTNTSIPNMKSTKRQDTPHFWNFQANYGNNVLEDDYYSGKFKVKDDNLNNGDEIEFSNSTLGTFILKKENGVTKVIEYRMNKLHENYDDTHINIPLSYNNGTYTANVVINVCPDYSTYKPVQVYGGRQEAYMYTKMKTPVSGYTNITRYITYPANKYLDIYKSGYPSYFPPVYDKKFIMQYKDNVKFDKAVHTAYDVTQNYKDISRMLQYYKETTALNIGTGFASITDTNNVNLPSNFGYSNSGTVATEFLYAPIIITPDQDPYMWNFSNSTNVYPALVKSGSNISSIQDDERTLFGSDVRNPTPLQIVSWLGNTIDINNTFDESKHRTLISLAMIREDSHIGNTSNVFGPYLTDNLTLSTFVNDPETVWPNLVYDGISTPTTMGPCANTDLLPNGTNVGFIENFNEKVISYPYYNTTNVNHQYVPYDSSNFVLETLVPPYNSDSTQFYNVQSRVYKRDNDTVVSDFYDIVYNNYSDIDTNLNFDISTFTSADATNVNIRNVYTPGSNLIGANFKRTSNYSIKTASIIPNVVFKGPNMNLGDEYKYKGVIHTGMTKYLNDTGYGQQKHSFPWPTQAIRSSKKDFATTGFTPHQSPMVKYIYGSTPDHFSPKDEWITGKTLVEDEETLGELNYYYYDYYTDNLLPNIGVSGSEHYQKYEDKKKYTNFQLSNEIEPFIEDLTQFGAFTPSSPYYFITDINNMSSGGETSLTIPLDTYTTNNRDTYKLIAITDFLDKAVPYMFQGVDDSASGFNPIWYRVNLEDESFEFKTLLLYKYPKASSYDNTTMLKSNFHLDDDYEPLNDILIRAKIDVTDAWSSVNDLTPYEQPGQLQDQLLPAYGCMPMSGGRMVWNELNYDGTGRVEENGTAIQERVKNYFNFAMDSATPDHIIEYKATKYTMSSSNVTTLMLDPTKNNYYSFTNKSNLMLLSVKFSDFNSSADTCSVTVKFDTRSIKNGTFFNILGAPSGVGLYTITIPNIPRSGVTSNTDIILTTNRDVLTINNNSDAITGLVEDTTFYNSETMYAVMPNIKSLNQDILKNLVISGYFPETTINYGLYLTKEFFDTYLADVLPGQGTYINAILNPFKSSIGDNIYYKSTDATFDYATNKTSFIYNFYDSNTPEKPENPDATSTKSLPNSVFYVKAPTNPVACLGYEGPSTTVAKQISYTKIQDFETPSISLGDLFIHPVTSDTVFTKIGGPRFFYYQEFDAVNNVMDKTKVGTFDFSPSISITVEDNSTLDLRKVFGLGTINSGGSTESNDMYQIALNDIKNFIARLTPGDTFLIEQPFDTDNPDYFFNVVSIDMLNYTVVIEPSVYNISTGELTTHDRDTIEVISEYTYIKLIKTSAGIDGSDLGVVQIYNLNFKEGLVKYNDANPTDYTDYTVVKPAIITRFDMISDSIIDKTPGRSIYNNKFNIIFCTSEYPSAKMFDLFGNFSSDTSDSTIASEYEINKKYNIYEIVASGGEQDVFFQKIKDTTDPPFDIENGTFVRSNAWTFLNIPESVVIDKVEWEPYKVYDNNAIAYRETRLYPYINYNTGVSLNTKDNIVNFFPSSYPFVLFRNENLDIKYYKSAKSSNQMNDPMFRSPYESYDPMTVYNINNPQNLAAIGRVKDCVQLTYTDWTQESYQGCSTPYSLYSNDEGVLSFDIPAIVQNLFVDQLSVKSSQGFTTEEITPFYIYDESTSTKTPFTTLPDALVDALGSGSDLNVTEDGKYIYLQDVGNDYYKPNSSGGYETENDPTPFFVKNYIDDTRFFIVYIPPNTDSTTYYINNAAGYPTVEINPNNTSINRDRIVASCLKKDVIWEEYDIPQTLSGKTSIFAHDSTTLYDNYKSNYTSGAYVTRTDTVEFSTTQTCVYFDKNADTSDYSSYNSNIRSILGTYVTAKYIASDDLYFLLTLQNTPCSYGNTTDYASDCNSDIFGRLNAQAVSFMPVDANSGVADVGVMGKPLCNPTTSIISNSKFDFANGLFLYFVPLDIGYQPPVGDNAMYCRIMTYYGSQFLGWLKFNRSIEINRDHEIASLDTSSYSPITSTCPAYVYYDSMNLINTSRETSVSIGNQIVQTKLKNDVTDSHVYYTANFEDECVFKVTYNDSNSTFDIAKLEYTDMFYNTSKYYSNHDKSKYHDGINSDFILAGSYWEIDTVPTEQLPEEGGTIFINEIGSYHRSNGVFIRKGDQLIRHKDFDTYDKIINNKNIKAGLTKFSLNQITSDIDSNSSGTINYNNNVTNFVNSITNTDIAEYYTSTPGAPGGTYIVNNPTTPIESGVFNQDGTDFTTPAPTDSTVYRITTGRYINTYWTVKQVNGINVVREVTYLYNDVSALTNRTNQLNISEIPIIDSFTREKTLAQGFPLKGLTLSTALNPSAITTTEDVINFREIRESRKPLELLTNIHNDCNIMFTYDPFEEANILYVYQIGGTSDNITLEEVKGVSNEIFEIGDTITAETSLLFMFKYAVYLNFEYLDKAPTFEITEGTGNFEILISYFMNFEQIGQTKPLGQNSDSESEFNTKFAARTSQFNNYVVFQPIKKAGTSGPYKFTISYDGTPLATFTVT